MGRGRGASRFLVDPEVNSRIYLWRGHPWNLEVDAVVNSTNEVGVPSRPPSDAASMRATIDVYANGSCVVAVCRAWTRRIVALGCMRRRGRSSLRSVPPWYATFSVAVLGAHLDLES